MNRLAATIVVLAFLGAGCEAVKPPATTFKSVAAATEVKWVQPLPRAEERVTKKPFGIKTADRFHGYHTGADFEIFDDEKDRPVEVRTVCAGPLRVKRTAAGYGGLVVQECAVDGAPVTVVYGHLKITSVTATIGSYLAPGTVLGVLGKGFSSETDGERKHLHLGIYPGTSINIAGYVARAADLKNWINPADLLF